MSLQSERRTCFSCGTRAASRIWRRRCSGSEVRAPPSSASRSKTTRQQVASLCFFCSCTPCAPKASTVPSAAIITTSPSSTTSRAGPPGERGGKALRSAASRPITLVAGTSLREREKKATPPSRVMCTCSRSPSYLTSTKKPDGNFLTGTSNELHCPASCGLHGRPAATMPPPTPLPLPLPLPPPPPPPPVLEAVLVPACS
mmetsp:Transcript_34275/g.107546  ORF Transcript_34275/g.107546 Transcript_34275/m.107546 type:complete len:201 (-) Transcript_34275:953-1555(-)